MSREVPRLLYNEGGKHINLGSGSGLKTIHNCIDIDYPEWDANKDRLPFEDNSIDVVRSYHFLEHIKNAKFVLEEVDRVLKPGGIMNNVVPYANSNAQFSSLDHVSFFNEKTFHRLFNEKTYKNTDYNFKLKVHAQWIIGIVERNLCLMTQLVKE